MTLGKSPDLSELLLALLSVRACFSGLLRDPVVLGEGGQH